MAPDVVDALSEFEAKAKDKNNFMDRQNVISSIFLRFPRKTPGYLNIINILASMAQCDTTNILQDLLKSFKYLILSDQNNLFNSLINLVPMYNNNVQEHRYLMFYLSVFFISDLLSVIIQRFGAKETESMICDVVYSISFCTLRVPSISLRIFDQWAFIVSLVSQTSFDSVISLFDGLIQSESYLFAFYFTKYVKFETTFPVTIFYDIAHRNSMLTPEIEEIAALVFLSAPIDVPLFSLVYEKLKESEEMTKTKVCSVIIQRINQKENELKKFIKTKILKFVEIEKTLENCLMSFWVFISGPEIPPLSISTLPLFQRNVPRLDFCRHHTNLVKSRFLISSFATTFFAKSNFSICKKEFTFVITHLAALNFEEFMEILFPLFTSLQDVNDVRFICFLQSIKYINNNIFKEVVPNEQISEFNSRISEKLREVFYQQFGNIDKSAIKSAVTVFDSKAKSSPLIAESQQKVMMFLAICHADFIKETEFHPNLAVSNPSNDLLPAVMRSIPYIFEENDFDSEKFMDILIDSTYFPDAKVSKHAHLIIRNKYPKNKKFVNILLAKIPSLTDDNQMFSCVRLLFLYIDEFKFEFDKEQFDQMEYIAFLCLAWHLPDTRNYGIQLLSITKGQFSTFFFSNKNLLLKRIRTKLQRLSNYSMSGDAEITISSIYNSYYYELWIYFLSELVQLMIEKEFTSTLLRLQSLLQKNYGSNMGYLMYFANSYFTSEASPNDNECIIFESLHQVLENGNALLVIKAIPLIHKSLAVPCLQILGLVDEDNIQAATKAQILLLNDASSEIITTVLPLIIQFLSVLNNSFIRLDINSPRVIKWDKSHEEKVLLHSDFINDYLFAVSSSFNSNAEISDDTWPSPSRDIMFRFLVNWAMTKSEKLTSVRNHSITAMLTMVKVGQIFNDTLLFDSAVVNLFGRIEKQRQNFLSYILYFHLELLLNTFIEAYFTQPRPIADLFLESIIQSATNQQIVYNLSGPMLLLIYVLKNNEHSRADELLHSFLKVSLNRPRKPISYDQLAKKLMESSYIEVVPEYFSYATEAIFDTGFKLINISTHVQIADICEAMRPWISLLRLLPKQSTCSPSCTKNFNFFTPYNFLVKLIETTEKVEEDSFNAVTSLWTELMKSPDHRELIILFLVNWRKPETKKKMFSFLSSDEAIVQRLSMNFSFAYYFHTTECQKRNFTNELWVVPIIFSAFRANWDLLEPHLVEIIHFVFLFSEDETRDFFKFICLQYDICEMDAIAAVKPMLERVNPEEWGNEALKWIIGCRSIKFSTRSFKIYNQILKPLDSNIPKMIAKSVLFHLKNNEDNKLLNELISESFLFMASAFNSDNEIFALQYLLCFIDSPYYLSISTQLLVKVLTSKKTSAQSWPSIIAMVDPLFTKIEDNEQIQKLFELFIKTSHNEELMMLVAPIKKLNPTLFPSSAVFDKLFASVSDSILCKVLPRYARMMKTASRSLMNSIFEISAMILDKVVDENNNPSLSQIYKFALHTLLECPNSIMFLNTLNRREAKVSVMPISDGLEYERTVDDVTRALKRLPQFVDTAFNSITDCKSFVSVVNFLDGNANPTILPFGAQQEMVDGMMRASQTTHMKKVVSLKKLNTQQSATGMSFRSGLMGFVPNLNVSQDMVLKPLMHPLALMARDKVCRDIPDAILVMSEVDFLRVPEL